MSNAATTNRPRIVGFDVDLDLLAEYPTVEIAGHNLREGMVLVDEFNTPVVHLETKQRTRRGSGCVFFYAYNFDLGRHMETNVHANATVRVIAR